MTTLFSLNPCLNIDFLSKHPMPYFIITKVYSFKILYPTILVEADDFSLSYQVLRKIILNAPKSVFKSTHLAKCSLPVNHR